MTLSAFSVRNKSLFNMLAIFIAIAGILALFRIPREVFPNISFDIVTVQTRYPGANAEQIETLITTPIERELKEVDDIKEIQSRSREGLSFIYLTIEPDARDKGSVVDEIHRAVNRVDDLPNDLADEPVVEEIEVKNDPMMYIALSGPFSQLDLQEWAKQLEDRLLDLNDVSAVERDGYYDPQMHVTIAPEKLAAYHTSLTEVGNALARQNVNVPGGTIITEAGEIILRTSGEFFTPQEIQSVVVRANDQGKAVTVGDLAEIVRSHERPAVRMRVDGARAVMLIPLKQEGVDIFDLKAEIQTVLNRFSELAPPGLRIQIVDDLSYYVERRLNVLIWNGAIGFALVMLSLFLFLSPSTALSALLGMPTTFLATIAIMHAFGISINLLSMFGLIIVIGMLVDEDIVVAENIHRLLQEGKSVWDATIAGATQVARAVVTTVLTTLTAFMPLLLMTGITGKFVRQIPQVVIITLLASLLEALFILPAHIASLSRSDKTGNGVQTESRASRRFLACYSRILSMMLRHRYKVMAGFILLFAGIALLGKSQLNFILFPKQGIEAFFVRIKLPQGTPLEVTETKIETFEAAVAQLPRSELDHFVTSVGLTQNDPNDPFTARGSHIAQIKVLLTPESKRDRNAMSILDSLRPQLETIGGVDALTLDTVSGGPPVGKPVGIRIQGDDFNTLEALAETVKQTLADIPGVEDIDDDYEVGKREKQIVIDPVKVAQAGLTLADAAQAVRFAFEGGTVTAIRTPDDAEDVLVKFPETLRYTSESLSQVVIANPLGNLIPLSRVADYQDGRGIYVIHHFDRDRTITVTAQVDERLTSSSEVNRQAREKLDSHGDRSSDITIHYGGEFESTDDSMASFYQAFSLALLFTFIIIAASLRDLVAPLVAMSGVILGLIGVVLGFLIQGETLSFLALLGVVAMAGVVVDSAILIIDFIHMKEREGLCALDAIAQGAVLRLRPILLTGGTTVLGIIPAAIGLGGIDPFIQPMALALNWGIGFATVTTVFFTPVLMAITRDLRDKIARRQKSC